MSRYEELLVGLVNAGVKFLTVGALACAFNGVVRATLDVDIVIQRTRANVEQLLKYLSSVGSGAARELSWEDFPDEPGAVRIIEDFPLDIFVRIGGFTYEDLLPWQRFYTIVRAGRHVEIPYVAAGLIAIKSSSRREQDRLDIAALRRVAKEDNS